MQTWLFFPSFPFLLSFPSPSFWGGLMYLRLTLNSLCNQGWHWTDFASNSQFLGPVCIIMPSLWNDGDWTQSQSFMHASQTIPTKTHHQPIRCDFFKKYKNIGICPSFISVAMINTLTKSNIKKERLIFLHQLKLKTPPTAVPTS